MGNQESVMSEDEGAGPAYKYHEEVLRQAQGRTGSNPVTPLALGLGATNLNKASNGLSDDEFYSADEGDSVGSITPPRTREESVSAGESLGHSEEEENNESNHSEDKEGNDESHQVSEEASEDSDVRRGRSGGFRVPESPALNKLNKPRGKKSCGQCNVSVFQEHDSIGPEIDMATQGENLTTQQPGSARNFSDRPRRSTRFGRGSTPSPFRPIFSPSVGNVQATSDALILAAQAGKRKSRGTPSDLDLSLSPPKRLTRSSAAGSDHSGNSRKRLGVFDSSSSESEEEFRTSRGGKRGRFANKKSPQGDKRRLRKDSQKRSRSRSHSSEHKQKRKKKGRRSYSSGSSGSAKHRSLRNKRRGHSPTSSYGRRSRSNSYSRSDSESESSSETEHSVRSRSSRRDRHISNSRDRRSSNQDADRTQEEQPPPGKKIQRLRVGAYNPVCQSRTLSSFPTRQPTDKMGDHAVRNPHGKVVPVRPQQERSYNDQNTPVSKPSSEAYLKTIAERLRSGSSAFTQAGTDRPLEQKGTNPSTPNATDSQQDNDVVVLPDKGTQKVSDYGDSAGNPPSPFKDFALVPPTQHLRVDQRSINSSNTQRDLAVTEIDETDNHLEVMEVDNEAMELMDSPSSDSFPSEMEHRTSPFSNSRSSLRLRSKQTVSDRFRNLWTTKRRDLGRSLKTLFENTGLKSPPRVSSEKSENLHAKQNVNNSESSSPPFGGRTDFFLTSSPRQNNFVPQNNSTPSLLAQSERISPIIIGDTWQQVSAQKRQLEHTNSPTTPTTVSSPPSPPPSPIAPVVSSPVPRLHLHSTEIELLPQTAMFQVLRFYAGGTEVSVSLGSVAEESTHGIVNWTDGPLTHTTTQCSKEVAAKAGALMRAGCHDYLDNKGGQLEAPDVLTTPAGGRFDRRVVALVHTVAPPVRRDEDRDTTVQRLVEVNVNCLRYADEKLGLVSLSMPLIGQELFPDAVCGQAFLTAVLVFLAEHSLTTPPSPPDLKLLQLVIPDPNTTDLMADQLSATLRDIETQGLESAVSSAYHQFCTLGQRVREQNKTVVVQAAAENNQRTASGRPRIKRPRL